MIDKAKHLSKNALKERGWTDASIKRFLGDPDSTRTNPHHKSGPPICLYDHARVDRAEASQDFRDWKVGSTKRSESARAVSARRADTLIETVNAWVPEVAALPFEEVKRRAICAYNDSEHRLRDEKSAGAGDNEAFLRRITFNYVRHELTDYDKRWAMLEGKPGVSDAFLMAAEKIADSISETYPELTNAASTFVDKKRSEAVG